ncbi:MAG TPA: serine hydrolase domain-containing protein, partial [Phycisphaerae bacterium]|nr:serine hydrolase domain-containing protein [Phycisphaerae bacterium]
MTRQHLPWAAYWKHVLSAVLACGVLLAGACTSKRNRGPEMSVRPARPALPPPASLDDRLDPIRAKHNVPALAAAVIRNDDIVALGAVGFRRLKSPETVTTADRFHLGSDTKAMTATMLAMLVERGSLRWDTTLAEAFPDLRQAMHPDYRPVTLEQLLQHRGGCPEDLNRDGLWKRLWEREGSPREQRELLVKTVLSWPPAAPPGTKFLYSNAGYAIAGVMAERVTGEAWEDLMRRMLFEPLGMASAGFGAPGDPAAIDEPRGHDAGWLRTKPMEPGPQADNPPAIGPAGTVHCSLPDWARFIRLHLHGEQGGTTLLKPETFVRLHTPPPGAD